MKKKVLDSIFALFLFVFFFFFNKNYILNTYQAGGLKASFEIITSEEDVFQLFYREPTEKFNEKFSERTKVQGTNNPQWLHYSIPDTLSVSHFRFDFGNNYHTSPVGINQMVLSFNGNNKIIPKEEFENYFKRNKYVELSSDGYIRKVISNRSDPFFISIDLQTLIGNLKNTPNYIPLILNIILSLLLALSCFFAMSYYNLKESYQNSATILFIAIFFGMMILPHLGEVFALDDTAILEKRKLTEKPEIILDEIQEYPEKFENYYNDNFGFRKKMVSISSTIKAKIFRTSSKPDRVVVGTDGWLFYWKEAARRSYLNENPFHSDKLKKLGKNILKLNKLAIKGQKDFVVTVYPNKHGVYENKIPRRIRMLKRNGIKRIDEFYDFLKRNEIRNVDHRRNFMNKKKHQRIYLKNDSHWNSLGSFYAYQEIINEISSYNESIFPPLNQNDFKINEIKDYKEGDLLDLLGIDNESGFFKDTYLQLVPFKEHVFEKRFNYYNKGSIEIENLDSNNNIIALLFGDSYSYELLNFLPIHFKKTIFIREINPTQEIIKKINPDIIIYGIVERNLENF